VLLLLSLFIAPLIPGDFPLLLLSLAFCFPSPLGCTHQGHPLYRYPAAFCCREEFQQTQEPLLSPCFSGHGQRSTGFSTHQGHSPLLCALQLSRITSVNTGTRGFSLLRGLLCPLSLFFLSPLTTPFCMPPLFFRRFLPRLPPRGM